MWLKLPHPSVTGSGKKIIMIVVCLRARRRLQTLTAAQMTGKGAKEGREDTFEAGEESLPVGEKMEISNVKRTKQQKEVYF